MKQLLAPDPPQTLALHEWPKRALQPFELRECLEGAHNLVAHEAERKGLALSCEVDGAVPVTLAGDRARLHQVLVNLLGNAVKFTTQGQVTLTAQGQAQGAQGYLLTVVIADTGIGIAASQLAQIFDPFVQADTATTRRIAGTGLGLAISKQLVELMGGQITATSRPGEGSTFTLRLPLRVVAEAPAARPARPAQAAAPAEEPLRVLLAEDNPINQEVLRRLLESLGYRPEVVVNGAEALAAVSRAAYDVVLMDIQMPELDGEAATRAIRARAGAITQPYIIALTASALRGDRERYLAAGMDDYLSKPVQVEDLRAALARPARAADGASAATGAQAPAAEGVAPAGARDRGLVDSKMLAYLLESIGGTQEEAATMVLELFRTTLAGQVGEIAAAIAAADRPLVRILAHKLRGGSRQLGAILLAEQWLALEEAAQQAEAPLAEHLDAARRAYGETLALLTEHLAAPGV